mgnify:CR=1 FL=1
MAGTVADILGLMELIDNELETASGEVDETDAITACIQAQHYLETLAASMPKILQSTVNVTTTNDTETTTWTSSILRLDAIWFLDSNSRPIRKLARIDEVGGHVPSLPWPFQVTLPTFGTGAPFAYYGNMANFYWLPRPDGTHTLRVYGFIEQTRFTVRTSAVSYPYRLHLPMAQFAAKLMSVGVNDDTMDLDRLAAQVYTPALRQLRKFDRGGPRGRHYTEFHTT